MSGQGAAIAHLPACAFVARQSNLYQGTYALYDAFRACLGAVRGSLFKLIHISRNQTVNFYFS